VIDRLIKGFIAEAFARESRVGFVTMQTPTQFFKPPIFSSRSSSLRFQRCSARHHQNCVKTMSDCRFLADKIYITLLKILGVQIEKFSKI
jgi:hypothetical protein